MRTLPLALLVFRGGCPVTEAYLAYMRLHDMRPAVIFAIDHVGEGRRAQQLRRLLGTRITAYLMRNWRNYTARVSSDLVAAVQHEFPLTLRPSKEPNYREAADRVVQLTVDGYADPRLLEAMRSCGVKTFLYCSGGRVPANLFQENFRILHIHPGVVPHVRGSDGLLWSLLARGRPGASIFYMNAGIDTGQLIATAEFHPPRWPGLDASSSSLYHALLHCYDPHLRAALLVSVLAQLPVDHDLSNLQASAQSDELDGHYYTMQACLRERVLARLCL